MAHNTLVRVKGQHLSLEIDTFEGFLNSYLNLQHQIPVLQGLMKNINQIHKDLLCGVTETGTILYSNPEFYTEFFSGAQSQDAQSFFSFIHPDDLKEVHEYLSGEVEDLIDSVFFCRMISCHHEPQWIKWRVWSHECLQEKTPIRYILIGTNTNKDKKNTILTDFYTLYLKKMEEERGKKINDIQEKLLQEISKREVIESEIANLINGTENEVVKLKEIINYTSQQILVFDISGDLQYINSQGAAHLGAPVNSLIGKNIADLPFQEQIIKIFSEYSNTPSKHDDPALSGMIEISSPAPHICFYSLIPLYDIYGIRESILMILRDASTHKEFQIPPQSPLAEDPKAVIDRALHTFNNLFTILLGNITLAQCSHCLDSEASQYLKNIETDIAKAGNLLYRYSLLSSSYTLQDTPFVDLTAESIAEDAPSGGSPPAGQIPYILFMDDETGIRNITSTVLQNCGFIVVTGHNGEAILKAYVDLKMDKQKVSCVILDLDVPDGMGALETLPHLKFFDPTLPVILTTGHTKHPITKNFKNYGFSGVITKPFYPRKLKEIIREILENRNNDS